MRSVCFDSPMILFLWLLICGVLAVSRDQTEDRNESQDEGLNMEFGIPGLVLRPECRYFVTHGRRCVFDRNKTKCSRKLTLSPRIDSILCPEQKPEIPCEEQECIDSQKIPFAVEQLEPDFDCNYLAVERRSCVLVKGQCLRVKDYEPRLNDRQCFRFNLTGPCPAERCGDQIPKTPMVDESDQRWKVKIGPDANCTYTVEESQHCFTIHGKCQKMNRLVVPGDRIRCEDLDYMELCSPPSLCQNDLGQTFPEVGHALVDCQYSKPVTIKGCQGTDYGCRKLMRITSKLVGLKPKCKNFIYWVACPEQICRDSRQSKHDPESDISTPCPFEGCDGTLVPEIPMVDRDVSSTIESIRKSTSKFDHWNVGKENWTDYEKTLYDAEVPEIFREFVDQAEGIVTTGSATKLECTYRTINRPCHFQKVMHKNQKKLTCLYFEDRIQVNNGAIGCESMIRSMKPCPLSECRKKCDEVLPPWSSWGPCSASCRSEDADYLGRSSQPFRMRHRFDDQRVRTGCKLTESIYCSNLPLCPPTKVLFGDLGDDYGQESAVRPANERATNAPVTMRHAPSTVPGTTALVLICVFAILTVTGALGAVFAMYSYYL